MATPLKIRQICKTYFHKFAVDDVTADMVLLTKSGIKILDRSSEYKTECVYEIKCQESQSNNSDFLTVRNGRIFVKLAGIIYEFDKTTKTFQTLLILDREFAINYIFVSKDCEHIILVDTSNIYVYCPTGLINEIRYQSLHYRNNNLYYKSHYASGYYVCMLNIETLETKAVQYSQYDMKCVFRVNDKYIRIDEKLYDLNLTFIKTQDDYLVVDGIATISLGGNKYKIFDWEKKTTIFEFESEKYPVFTKRGDYLILEYKNSQNSHNTMYYHLRYGLLGTANISPFAMIETITDNIYYSYAREVFEADFEARINVFQFLSCSNSSDSSISRFMNNDLYDRHVLKQIFEYL